MKADLHMHSTYSDGGYDPLELVEKCARGGLTVIALTDHDTTGGLEAAQKQARKHGIRFVPGIELSTRAKGGRSVDILGYNFRPEDEAFQETIAYYRSMRKGRMEEMIQKCQSAGMDIEWSDILPHVTGHTYSRPHMAKALVDKGYAKTVKDAFDKYIGYGRPVYVPKKEELTPEEAISVLQKAGGIAVVAHPVFYDIDDQIEEWAKDAGLDGVEVYHRDHSEKAIERFSSLCDKIERESGRKMLRTGGSDFHHESFGREGEELGITKLPNEHAEQFLERL
ncbi:MULTISPECIES: PHP domain-containing protein [Alteribacter]|uniref:PHP domain-containing protein n=1 Tax=Alteribacter keqinensis TaxID=2483800 RepID=A0A3M7TYC8_9BACI|nr:MULTISPECIES: PHP domain-containing protein [Alteribacter]MBM7094320.1 PHP domain-containing protein [Alteribacter salitolerans]RNA70608.1 PHP domain-containing protein [Alteribacter keqinensis]